MNPEQADWQAFRDNLAYYVADMLSEQEKASMEAFIASHPRAQAEVDAEQRLRVALRADADRIHVDVEAGVERLLLGLKAKAASRSAAHTLDDTGDGVIPRLRRWLDCLGAPRLAAGAAAVVIAQAFIIAMLIPREVDEPASGFRGTTPGVAAQADFKLYPNADSAFAELAELLLSTGCTFVHGPDADGAIHVNCSAANGHEQQQRADAALRASPLLADVIVLEAD